MRISLIVAMDRNGVIGQANALPWRLPADLAHFKRLTMGHPLIVGRKTWDAIGRALPGRRMIVLSRDPAFKAPEAEVVNTLGDALQLAGAGATKEVFIGGGAEIFRMALPVADRIYLTEIDHEFPGDTYFPNIERQEWEEVAREAH